MVQVIQAEVVEELTGFLGGEIVINPIQGGAINLSFSVDQGERRYFLKLFDVSTIDLLDRARLFRQQRILAVKGMAPKPIYLSAQGNFQLEEWIEQSNLTQSELSTKQKCLRLAKALNDIHQLCVRFPPLDLSSDWQNYMRLSGATFSRSQLQAQQQLLSLWRLESEEYSVLCHNDLSFSHVPESDSGVIFDWEYAAFNSPYFDIASCCIINQFDKVEIHIVIEEYARLAVLDNNIVSGKVHSMLAVVNKTYELWALACTKIPN